MREQPGLFDTQVRQSMVAKGWRPDSFPLIKSAGIKLIALDDETTGNDKWADKPVGTAVALENGVDAYIPYGHLGGGNYPREQVQRWKRAELRDVTIVNLNTGFDVEMELNDGINLESQGCRVVDVAHHAALLNEHRYGGFNLAALGEEYCGRGKVECPVAAKDIHRVHAGEVAPYARGDARLALDVYVNQLPRLAEEDLGRVADLESRLIYVVNEMERNGAPVDLPKLQRWRTQIKQEIADGLLWIHRQTGLRVNPNSPHDMKRLFDYLGLEFVDIQGDTLKAVKHPVIQRALWVKRRLSLQSKYLDKYWHLAKDTGVLRYALHQLRAGDGESSGLPPGTITGRFSSSGGRVGQEFGINCQQVMKPSKQRKKIGDEYIVRELFIPAKSCEWVSSDAAQIEFRLFGHYANNRMMIDAYKRDPWTDFYQFVVDMLMEVANYKIERDDSKVLNLAKIYGQGKDKRMAGLNVDEATEAKISRAYDQAFPEANRLMRKTMQLAEERGWVRTLLGRRGRFPDKDRYYRAFNKIDQGSAADIMKLKMVRAYEQRKELELTMRMTVHDELDGDLANPEKKPAFEAMMAEQEFPTRVPIMWDTGYGANWMEACD